MTAPAAQPRLGFVGLGIMGVPMVQRLMAQGFALSVWNREPERGALVEGARWCSGPDAVRAASDIVVTCVLDGPALEACCFGPNGFARAGEGADLLLDCSTIEPDATLALAARLQSEAGMSWVDAPISGGPQAAGEGKLAILAGGSAGDVARVRPVLEALAHNVTRMGPLGAGQTAKTINQAVVGVNYTLMAEVLALAEAAGIDAAALPAALAGGLADSTILQRIYTQMAAREFDPPRAYARQLDKDLKALARFIDGLGLELPVVAAAIARYHAYVAAGHELSDSAAISEFYRDERSGRHPNEPLPPR
jgi:3-hydroxyisobutyrate dehydrogenase